MYIQHSSLSLHVLGQHISGKGISNKCGNVALGITDGAKETAELYFFFFFKKNVWHCRKERWTWKKGSEQRNTASCPCKGYQSRSWKRAGNLGETLINGVREVNRGTYMGNC